MYFVTIEQLLSPSLKGYVTESVCPEVDVCVCEWMCEEHSALTQIITYGRAIFSNDELWQTFPC